MRLRRSNRQQAEIYDLKNKTQNHRVLSDPELPLVGSGFTFQLNSGRGTWRRC